MQLFMVQHKPKFVLFSENTEFEHRDLSNKKVSRANAEYQVIGYGIKNQFSQTAFFSTVDALLNQIFLEKIVPFLEKRPFNYPATSTVIVNFLFLKCLDSYMENKLHESQIEETFTSAKLFLIEALMEKI